MKPAKLKKYLTSIHPKNELDSVDSFRSKKARFEKAETLLKFGFIKTQKQNDTSKRHIRLLTALPRKRKHIRSERHW